jgi:hypothetical protein
LVAAQGWSTPWEATLAVLTRPDEAWVEGFDADSCVDARGPADRVQTAIGCFGDMKAGDVIECTVIPEVGTGARSNGSEKGAGDGAGFAAVPLRVRPGPKPP